MHYIERNWDILVILDACRYDSFKTAIEILGWKGNLETYRVKASTTEEYRDLWPTLPADKRVFYVSGNGYINTKNCYNKFKVINAHLWGWSDRHDVTLPEPVTDAVMTLAVFGEKIVAHYMPPHIPFISESSRLDEWRPYMKPVKREKGWRDAVPFPPDIPNAKIMLFDEEYVSHEIKLLKEPDKDLYNAKDLIQMIKRAYLSNLFIVLRDISRLRRYLKRAKIVITADHGSLLGETYKKGYDPNTLAGGATVKDVKKWGMWWHLPKFRHPALNIIPWFELESQ